MFPPSNASGVVLWEPSFHRNISRFAVFVCAFCMSLWLDNTCIGCKHSFKVEDCALEGATMLVNANVPSFKCKLCCVVGTFFSYKHFTLCGVCVYLLHAITAGHYLQWWQALCQGERLCLGECNHAVKCKYTPLSSASGVVLWVPSLHRTISRLAMFVCVFCM